MLRRTFAVALASLALSSCTTIQEIGALRSVDFRLDRVSELRVAGIDFSRIQTASDLTVVDAARVASALAGGRLPLSFRVHLLAQNPASNSVTARLVRMHWTLLLENTETVSGEIEREYRLPPGQTSDIPIEISLDLLDFYERSRQELIELAMNVAGNGGQPKEIAIRAVPTIDTPLGGIRYPRPITIVSGSIGRSNVAQVE